MTFNVASKLGLKGGCDFLISAQADTVQLDSPSVCVFEAKNDNLEDWYGQCRAKMYAARLFNAGDQEAYKTIFGAVANGTEWPFLLLKDSMLWVDCVRYALANLPQLSGAIQKVYDCYTGTGYPASV